MRIKPICGPSVTRSKCRCEHIAVGDVKSKRYTKWRQERWVDRDPSLCRHFAMVQIDGAKYCDRHAGRVLLSHFRSNGITRV